MGGMNMVNIVNINDDRKLKDLCCANNIQLYLTDLLTCKDKGFCYYDGDEYHVFINSKMSFWGQRKTMIHELIHIFEDHFSCINEDRDKCENEVHNIIKKFNHLYNEEFLIDLIE